MSNAILNKSLGMARDLLPNAKADRKTKISFSLLLWVPQEQANIYRSK